MPISFIPSYINGSIYANIANTCLYPYVPPQDPSIFLKQQEVGLMPEFLPCSPENGTIRMPFVNTHRQHNQMFFVRAVLENDGTEHYGFGHTKFEAKIDAAKKVKRF